MLRDKRVGHRGNRRGNLRKGVVAGRPHQSVALGKAKLRGRKSKGHLKDGGEWVESGNSKRQK